MELDEISNTVSALVNTDASRIAVTASLDQATRSDLGQYMTPAPVAKFLASMFENLPEHVRLLDAGAGMGALTAAFVNDVCARDEKPKSISVTAFEVDRILVKSLTETLAGCAIECEHAGIAFKSVIINEDFILHAATLLDFDQNPDGRFNCSILNPPYAKISSASKTRKALRQIGIETTNLYTAFVAIALDRLDADGQLVAITPRSFCNGTYFQPFREFMLERSALRRVHVYESRKNAFKDDAVLQENIVFRVTKTSVAPEQVCISTSHDPSGMNSTSRLIPFAQVVLPRDPNLFIRLPVSEEDGDLAHRTRTLPCSLHDLGITVSTGRVVDFRAKEHLRMAPEEGAVPLIYPGHFKGGMVAWPNLHGKKPNALSSNDQTKSLLVPNDIYVLTKRFSSKEEKRRLVAVVYYPELINTDCVGFDNKLNYFHINGKGLPRTVAKGLAIFLNSTAVDQYFRQFSGHTQVNATDLRTLHYPTISQLEAAGELIQDGTQTQEEIDSIVERILLLS
jgi:adenine-specific DNA-methyltransferase